MKELFIFILMSWSIYSIVKHQKIFAWFRELVEDHGGETAMFFIKCPVCFGFWTGILLALLGFSPMMELSNWPAPWNWYIGLFFTGTFSSASTFLLDCLTLGIRTAYRKS